MAQTTGFKNVANEPSIKSSKVLLPPIQIKLGLIKNFVKALDVNGSAFTYVKNSRGSVMKSERQAYLLDLKSENFSKITSSKTVLS